MTPSEQVGDITLEDDRVFITMLDRTGRPVQIDCTIVDASVISAMIRTMKGIVAPVHEKRKVTRVPTDYNRHIGVVLKGITDPLMSRKDRLKYAVDSWADTKRAQRGPIVSVRENVIIKP